MEKVCKNCKYFEKEEDRFVEKNFGSCLCEKFVYLHADKYDESYAGDEFEKLILEDDMVAYEDAEMYAARFYVGGNFGCVHFQAAKEKNK